MILKIKISTFFISSLEFQDAHALRVKRRGKSLSLKETDRKGLAPLRKSALAHSKNFSPNLPFFLGEREPFPG